MKKKIVSIYLFMLFIAPFIVMTASANEPPSIPIITGPTNGKTGEDLTYTFVSTDPDGDDLIETLALNVGEAMTFYASGYNNTGGFVGLTSVDWSQTPTIGTFSVATGDTTVFTAGITEGYHTTFLYHFAILKDFALLYHLASFTTLAFLTALCFAMRVWLLIASTHAALPATLRLFLGAGVCYTTPEK